MGVILQNHTMCDEAVIEYYYQNLNIFNKKNNKLNKKSIYFWLIIIIIACISYISLESILYFNRLGEPILFLKIYIFL